MTSVPETPKRLTPELLVTVFIVLAYLAWLLSLPVWPSQDGPIHLYYTQVFGALLSHQPTPYAHFFTIKHLFPPYALYYYALLALSKIVPLVLADRLIICGYVISFIFGFRYFARALGPAADTTTLLATLLLFNWSLGMGFVNFCLSLSFAFWAIGLWLRFQDRSGSRLDLRRRLVFVALAFVIMFTHPVPLLFFLAVCGVFFLVDLLLRKDPRRLWSRRGSIRDLVTLALAGLTVLYVKLYTTAHPFARVEPEKASYLSQLISRTLAYAREDGVIPLFGHIPSIYIYRLAIGVLLVLPIVVGLRQRLRNRAAHVWTHADTMFVLGLLLLVLLPIIPPELNGLFFFAARLPLIVWVGLLLAASGSVSLFIPPSPAKNFKLARAVLLGFALVSNAALLAAGERIVRPIARMIAAVDNTPANLSGQVGFVIEDPRDVPLGRVNNPSWYPFFWAYVHVLRHNNAILANAPWMDETILPVGAAPALPVQALPALQLKNPKRVYGALMASPTQRTTLMSLADFFVVSQIDRPNDGFVAKGLIDTVPSDRNLWSCAAGPSEWYLLCEKRPSAGNQ